MSKLRYLGSHTCKTMEHCNTVAVEKYSLNGKIGWYHLLILERENSKMMAIRYCPYCGEKLEE